MIAPWQNLLQQYGAIFDQNSPDRVVNFSHGHSEEAKFGLNGNAIIPLAYTLIEVSGADAKKFLQGQLSCDLNSITPQNSSLGAYCNIKGRISALFRLCQQSTDSYLLRLPSSMAAATIAELKKYGAFSKVSIKSLADEFVVLGLVGAEVIEKLASGLAANSICIPVPGNIQRAELYLPYTEALTVWPTLTEMAPPCGSNAWELLEIMAGLPEIYPATKDAILPHDINLPALNAVSFSKGCYRGQEIVARMQYRGKIKRHLYTGKIQDVSKAINPGDSVYISGAGADDTTGAVSAGASVGTIIRLAYAADDTITALLELADSAVNAALVTADDESISII